VRPAPRLPQGMRRAAGLILGALTALSVMAAGWPAGEGAPLRGAPPARRASGLPGSPAGAVPVPGGQHAPPMPALRRLLRPDLMVVSPVPLPRAVVAAVRGLPGVRAAEPVDAARIQVNGKYIAVLGVDAAGFRAFADRPTARHTALWRAVAGGDMAISYSMGRLDRLPVGTFVKAVGRQRETLLVGGVGTVGIAGVDAVVSDSVARSLGFPAGNALVISTASPQITKLAKRIRKLVPRQAAVEQLVIPGARAASGLAGTVTAASGSHAALLNAVQVTTMLKAALSRVGMPYVWGANGPSAFDCSGLVQWSLAQAGVVMPRVAADQARTGPAVPLSRLQPGDLLFFHTDPTAPTYISHVAIYLGNGRMIQAPQPGLNVEIVPVDLGSDFAGAVAVSPRIAATVAAAPVG
jgi:peptidoglycan DL-endopeptidase CwlO